MRRFLCAWLLAAVLAGCNLPARSTAAVTPLSPATSPVLPTKTPLPLTPLPPSPTATPASGALSLDLLKNFTYWIMDYNVQAAFVDGVYQVEPLYGRVIEPVAFGDLNGDGRQDAAVVLAINGGGSGTFFDLVTVLDQDGAPLQMGFEAFGDRQVVNRLEIVGGSILLDYLTQDRDDGLCCPSERRLRSYLLENGGLRLASEQVLDNPASPETPFPPATPLPNAILLDQPAEHSALANPLQVSGRVSQVPPEEKLTYSVTDMQGMLLAHGEIPVQGAPGGPGSFAFELSVETGDYGVFQLEIVDAAGGVLRGRSVVTLLGP